MQATLEPRKPLMTRSNRWVVTMFFAAAGLACAATLDTPLASAVKLGDVAAVKSQIAKKADINAVTSDSSTALHLAVKAGNLDMVNLLIDAGANVNAVTRYKITPLAIAAANGNAAIIERLLKAGVDANSTS